ncbi:MAG: hypothetical protein HZC40_19710 [Chloroflexi bacterium]|nr:hypothetical protein [Chloroflexota bacterium]
MGELKLRERTIQFLQEPILGNQDLDTKVRMLIEGEYMRRLAAYHHTNRTMTRKYEMSFDEFNARQIVKERGFTWEVESDAMNWEIAVDGIETFEKRLRELRQSANEQRD